MGHTDNKRSKTKDELEKELVSSLHIIFLKKIKA